MKFAEPSTVCFYCDKLYAQDGLRGTNYTQQVSGENVTKFEDWPEVRKKWPNGGEYHTFDGYKLYWNYNFKDMNLKIGSYVYLKSQFTADVEVPPQFGMPNANIGQIRGIICDEERVLYLSVYRFIRPQKISNLKEKYYKNELFQFCDSNSTKLVQLDDVLGECFVTSSDACQKWSARGINNANTFTCDYDVVKAGPASFNIVAKRMKVFKENFFGYAFRARSQPSSKLKRLTREEHCALLKDSPTSTVSKPSAALISPSECSEVETNVSVAKGSATATGDEVLIDLVISKSKDIASPIRRCSDEYVTSTTPIADTPESGEVVDSESDESNDAKRSLDASPDDELPNTKKLKTAELSVQI